MKVWTSKRGPRRVLHMQFGHWKIAAVHGRIGMSIERQAPGAYTASVGPVFLTALRRNFG